MGSEYASQLLQFFEKKRTQATSFTEQQIKLLSCLENQVELEFLNEREQILSALGKVEKQIDSVTNEIKTLASDVEAITEKFGSDLEEICELVTEPLQSNGSTGAKIVQKMLAKFRVPKLIIRVKKHTRYMNPYLVFLDRRRRRLKVLNCQSLERSWFKVKQIPDFYNEWQVAAVIIGGKFTEGSTCAMFVGGYLDHASIGDCYKVQFMTGQYFTCDSLCIPRACPGTCVDGNFVYAFGGYKNTPNGEYYDIAEDEWYMLPDFPGDLKGNEGSCTSLGDEKIYITDYEWLCVLEYSTYNQEYRVLTSQIPLEPYKLLMPMGSS